MDNTLNLHPEAQQAHQLNFADEDQRATGLRDQKDDEMINPFTPGMSLPCQADRQKIMEQAKLVLAEARIVAEQSDRTLALLAAEQPVEQSPQPLAFPLTVSL